MGNGFVSHRTVQLIDQLRAKGVLFIYVTASRAAVLQERLKVWRVAATVPGLPSIKRWLAVGGRLRCTITVCAFLAQHSGSWAPTNPQPQHRTIRNLPDLWHARRTSVATPQAQRLDLQCTTDGYHLNFTVWE